VPGIDAQIGVMVIGAVALAFLVQKSLMRASCIVLLIWRRRWRRVDIFDNHRLTPSTVMLIH